MIKGYKAFNKDLTNRYGSEFVEGTTYRVEGELKFGNNGNGFHFCKRLEDTLRYFPGMEEEIDIASIGSCFPINYTFTVSGEGGFRVICRIHINTTPLNS